MNKITFSLLLLTPLILSGCTLKTPPASTPTPTSPPITAVASPTTDESALLKTAVKQALIAKHGDTANGLTISVSKIIGDYSSGMASETGGGGLWFAAKVDGQWRLVWDGNGIINCEDLAAYSEFPSSMIPQCFHKTTGKMLTR